MRRVRLRFVADLWGSAVSRLPSIFPFPCLARWTDRRWTPGVVLALRPGVCQQASRGVPSDKGFLFWSLTRLAILLFNATGWKRALKADTGAPAEQTSAEDEELQLSLSVALLLSCEAGRKAARQVASTFVGSNRPGLLNHRACT